MDIEQAQKIVNSYGAALGSAKDGECARRISSLPADRDTVIKAFKLFLAHYIEVDGLTTEVKEQFIVSLCCINIFVLDSEADSINSAAGLSEKGVKADDPRLRNMVQFMIENAFDSELVDEINEFIDKVQSIHKNDPIYHQRIYTYAGVEYPPRKNQTDTFWSKLFKGK